MKSCEALFSESTQKRTIDQDERGSQTQEHEDHGPTGVSMSQHLLYGKDLKDTVQVGPKTGLVFVNAPLGNNR